MERVQLTGILSVCPGGYNRNNASAVVSLYEPTPSGKKQLNFMKCPKQFLDLVSGPDWRAEVSFTADPFGNRPAGVKLLNNHVNEETRSEEHGTC